MSSLGIGYIGLAALLALLALRLPIGISLLIVSFGGIWGAVGWDVAWSMLGIAPFGFAANWVLSSVPMFLMMGYIAYHAELTEGLFDAARKWMSGLPGGLAVSAVVGSSGFAAVTGSSVACSAAMGRIAIPVMLKFGYQPALATGSVAVAGTIGALIPPSIILILYGVITRQPIPDLFLGGVAVGLLSAIAYSAVIIIRVKLNPTLAPQSEERIPLHEKVLALRQTWPILLVIFGVLFGMFAGVFTATEAGALGAFLACVIGILKRTLNWDRLSRATMECVVTTGSLVLIGVGATLFARFLVLTGVGDSLAEAMLSVSDNKMIILAMIIFTYLLFGMFLEPIGAMLLSLPIFLPIIQDGGYNMIWFGVLLAKLLEIGMVTPPIGINTFVVKSVVGHLVPIQTIFRGVAWFVVVDLLIVLIMVLFPEIVLFLPNWLN